MTDWEFTYEDGDSDFFELSCDQNEDLQDILEGATEGAGLIELFHQNGHCFINLDKVRSISLLPQETPKPKSKRSQRRDSEEQW